MKTIQGIGVYSDLVMAPVHLYCQDRNYSPIKIDPENIDREIERLDASIVQLAESMDQDFQIVKDEFGLEIAKIFEAHKFIITDPHLREQIVEKITSSTVTAASAIAFIFDKYSVFFQSQEGDVFPQRAADFHDIKKRWLDLFNERKNSDLSRIDRPIILAAHELTPSEIVSLNAEFVKGIVTETGGRSSHMAIVTAAKQIPTIVGLGSIMNEMRGQDILVLDSYSGKLTIRPDKKTLDGFEKQRSKYLKFESKISATSDLPSVTEDGVSIELHANIEFPYEAEQCQSKGADGIGLYRTEFIYLDRNDLPSEEEHFQIYMQLIDAVGKEKPVIIRTLDLGGDKLPQSMNTDELNPFLGLRSIRLALSRPDIFKPQLRAILRASTFGNIKIMFPLISTIKEIRQCRMLLKDVMEELEEEGVAINAKIPVGMMVEVPSAAVLARKFARYVDFFSIGTNDLIQYTLAADRNNERVSNIYDDADPGLWKLVQTVVSAAKSEKIELSVCGEVCSNPIYTVLLIGMGIRKFSLLPHNIPQIRMIIRSISSEEALKIAQRMKRLETSDDVHRYLSTKYLQIKKRMLEQFDLS